QTIALETRGGFIDAPRAAVVERAGVVSETKPDPVLTYLANAIRSGDREVPYSLVTAFASPEIAPELLRRVDAGLPRRPPPIVLNDWTARQLAVKPGDTIALDYYVWHDPGVLETR